MNRVLLSCASLLLAAPAVEACSIPVFRYALERWDLTPYEIVVFHKGDMPPDVDRYLDKLVRPRHRANVRLRPVDLDDEVPTKLQALWVSQGKPKALPWVVVRPLGSKAAPLWAGPFDKTKLDAIIDSPARQTLVERLSKGESAVFVLLLSGDAKADVAAAELLDKQLPRLEKLVTVPEQKDDGPRIRLPLPLQVRFSKLTVRRDQPGEETLVKMLLGCEDGLDRAKGPIILPVFGRGRALGGLYGEDLNAVMLLAAAKFLCGECSCEIKDANPGADLLLAADWDDIFDKMEAAPVSPTSTELLPPPTPKEQPSPSARDSFAENAPSVIITDAEKPTAAVEPDRPANWWLTGATLAAAVLVLATGAWAASTLMRRCAGGA